MTNPLLFYGENAAGSSSSSINSSGIQTQYSLDNEDDLAAMLRDDTVDEQTLDQLLKKRRQGVRAKAKLEKSSKQFQSEIESQNFVVN